MTKTIYYTFALVLFLAINGFAQNKKSLDRLKINQIQVLGTHNSYAKPVDSSLLAYTDEVLGKLMPNYKSSMSPEQRKFYEEYHPNEVLMSEALKYDHPTFPEQLNAGLRSLEIDVYYDPTGNRFNDPAGYRLMKNMGKKVGDFDTTGLNMPGIKVMHVADLDFRTHYPTFKDALLELKKWSNKNSNHVPIFIMIEAKDTGMPIFPGAAEVLPFNEDAFNEIDADILGILGRDKVIVPDDIRSDFSTLREAVLANNWPTVGESRGKFIFIMLPGGAGSSRDKSYLINHPSLKGRVMFMQSQLQDDHAAFLLLDNAIVRQNEIQQAVKQGYLVRTRADIETYEAKVNDTTRAEAAFKSGAQVISTDFFRKGNTYGTEYYVKPPKNKEAFINDVNK